MDGRVAGFRDGGKEEVNRFHFPSSRRADFEAGCASDVDWDIYGFSDAVSGGST
jgi:hypothetical protein